MWDSHQEGVEIGTSRMGAYGVLEAHAMGIKKGLCRAPTRHSQKSYATCIIAQRRLKMNLYEINEAIRSCVDHETGEIIVPEMLDALEMEKSDKVENIALWIKDLNAEAAAIKAEKDNLARRQKSCENKAASLKQYLTQSLGGQKFKTARVVISWRKSSAVEIMDESKIPAEYHIPQPDKIDKLAIKDALKTGEVAGAQLVEHSSIQIK